MSDGRKVSKKSRNILRRFYKRKCQYCFLEVGDTFDHIVPKSKQGGNNLWNITLACKPCNEEKSNKRLPSEQEEELLRRAAQARSYVLNRHDEAIRRHSRLCKRMKHQQTRETSHDVA